MTKSKESKESKVVQETPTTKQDDTTNKQPKPVVSDRLIAFTIGFRLPPNTSSSDQYTGGH